MYSEEEKRIRGKIIHHLKLYQHTEIYLWYVCGRIVRNHFMTSDIKSESIKQKIYEKYCTFLSAILEDEFGVRLPDLPITPIQKKEVQNEFAEFYDDIFSIKVGMTAYTMNNDINIEVNKYFPNTTDLWQNVMISSVREVQNRYLNAQPNYPFGYQFFELDKRVTLKLYLTIEGFQKQPEFLSIGKEGKAANLLAEYLENSPFLMIDPKNNDLSFISYLILGYKPSLGYVTEIKNGMIQKRISSGDFFTYEKRTERSYREGNVKYGFNTDPFLALIKQSQVNLDLEKFEYRE